MALHTLLFFPAAWIQSLFKQEEIKPIKILANQLANNVILYDKITIENENTNCISVSEVI